MSFKSKRGDIFKSVQMQKMPSNYFDLSYDRKLSMKMGQLVPVHCQEVLPGDCFKQSVNSLIRFAPLISPMMHAVNATIHFYFVPNRLLWPNWEKFITTEGGSDTPAAPYITDSGVPFPIGSLADYLDIPADGTRVITTGQINALPFSAYQLIYQEYYRDENLVDDVFFPLVDGNNNANINLKTLRTRAWGHDYFTSALPFAQKGDAVTIPLGTFNDVPVVANNPLENFGVIKRSDGTVPPASDPVLNASFDGVVPGGSLNYNNNGANLSYYDPNGTLIAQTSDLAEQANTINDLRTAFAIQYWLERNARGGTRYTEFIRAHFGVKSSDARLQRPEYLGGSKTPVTISEVLQTSQSDTTPQANMAGHAVALGAGKQFEYCAEEYGFIIGIMSVLPVTAYQQGLPRMFSRPTLLDYYAPEFAHLGEQEILNKEIYYDETDSQNDVLFGYTPRYAEYKYNASRVNGDFRTTLDFWHMGRIFDSRPALNANFVTSDPTTRIFAVTDPGSLNLYVQVAHQISARRIMPVFGTPKLVG